MNDTHRLWRGMIERCKYKTHHKYHRYGGRGISVCERWLVYENFVEDMGLRPDGKTLDRIDNDGNYEPSNCRWTDHETQHRNKSSNHMITYQGESKCLTAWAEEYGIKRETLSKRIGVYGWEIGRALTTRPGM